METRAHEGQSSRNGKSGGSLSETTLWWNGPEKWPDNLATEPFAGTEAVEKAARELLCTAQVQ